MADNKQNNNKSLAQKPVSINTIFWIINLALLVFALFQAYQIISYYNKAGKDSVKSSKKIIIDAKTNNVDGVVLTDDEMKSFDPEFAAKLEEKKKDEEKKKLEEAAKKEEDLKKAGKTPGDYAKANLGIVVTEVGQTQEGIDILKELPKEVSVAFSPYSDELQKKIDFQRREGREVLLNIVLEPSGFPVIDTGPLTIFTSSEPSKNIAKLETTIGENKDFLGFLTIRNEIVTHNLDAISPVVKKIKDLNLFFGFNKISVNSYLETEVKPMSVDIFTVDYMIDEKPTAKDILAKLKLVERDIISNKKRVVISIKPYKNSVQILKKWLEENLGENIQIAPISYFVTDN